MNDAKIKMIDPFQRFKNAFIQLGRTGAKLNRKTKFYQTENAMETIAIIEDPDGSISIGIARAGRIDTEQRRITKEAGMDIAEGRAVKARVLKTALIEKNYLRGIHAIRVKS